LKEKAEYNDKSKNKTRSNVRLGTDLESSLLNSTSQTVYSKKELPEKNNLNSMKYVGTQMKKTNFILGFKKVDYHEDEHLKYGANIKFTDLTT
jgi:hypothetical protein